MQPLKDHILRWWKRHLPHQLPSQLHLLLAVSGGVDSVVLTDVVAQSGIDFSILHCNFQLRGAESERDEQFVRSLATRYGKEVLVKKFDTESIVAERKSAVQEVARDLRYEWFEQVRGEYTERFPEKAVWIAVAHHADDNIETVLMNLFRGTGLHGLTGMEPFRGKMVRPLLNFRKEELKAYAVAQGLDSIEDSSNLSNDYTRNYFRNELIPGIKKVFPSVENNLLHTIGRLKEADSLYHVALQKMLGSMIEQKGNEYHIPVLLWKQVTPLMTITYELIKDFGFSAAQTVEAIKLLEAENSSYIASKTHRLIRNRNWMIIAPLANEHDHVLIPVDSADISVAFAEGTIQLSPTTSATIPDTNMEVVIDADALQYPMLLRPWKQGDYFYPLGMPKKKKISRFLGDLKLSKTEKEKVWVLESGKKIVWVLGLRIDHRFRITDQTQQKMSLTYLK
ncbi:MAG TPA: tRNA lysidine(34) synthetase TilS [Chitinophagaceae bacterium]|nr:tRNA lysidine(34) synthetase TilS [Chitinophagaceae bacterium]